MNRMIVLLAGILGLMSCGPAPDNRPCTLKKTGAYSQLDCPWNPDLNWIAGPDGIVRGGGIGSSIGGSKTSCHADYSSFTNGFLLFDSQDTAATTGYYYSASQVIVGTHCTFTVSADKTTLSYTVTSVADGLAGETGLVYLTR